MTAIANETVLFEETSARGIKTQFIHITWREPTGREFDTISIRSSRPGHVPLLLSLGQYLIGPLREALTTYEDRMREKHLAKPASVRRDPRPAYAPGQPHGGKVSPT